MVLKRNDLAGKTGSTNDHRDAWFTGFDSKLVASCWVGFDDFSSLGRGEFGAKAALPIWIDYMRSALKDVPEQPFDMPPGITRVRVDAASGLLAAAGDPGAILEVMKAEDATRLASQPTADRRQKRRAERSLRRVLMAGRRDSAATSRTQQMRRRIAIEAARLMTESGLRDYGQAKLKAAERLGDLRRGRPARESRDRGRTARTPAPVPWRNAGADPAQTTRERARGHAIPRCA